MSRVYSASDDISIEELEEVLDFLAHAINNCKHGGEGFFPIWHRIEHEIRLRRERTDVLSAVRLRIKQSQDQKAAVFSASHHVSTLANRPPRI